MTLLVTGPEIQTSTRVATHSSSSGSSYDVTGAVCSSYSYRTTEGSRAPNYWQLKKAGKLIPFQPFTQFELDVDFSGYRIERTTTVATGDWVQTETVGSATPVTYDPHELVLNDMSTAYSVYDAQVELVQRCAAAIASEGWDVLTFTIELHKTRDMFLNVAQKMIALRATFLRSFAKGIKKRDLQRFYDAWLEGRYGWRTLIYDLEDLNKLVTSLGKVKPSRQTRFRVTDISPGAIDISSSVPSGALLSIVETHSNDQVSLNGHVAADISFDALQTNLAVTAWELIPYSFVIDWFVGVGQAIQAGTFLASAESYTSSGGLAITRQYNRRVTGVPINSNPLYEVTGSQLFTADLTATLKTRTIIPISFIPHWAIKMNAFKVIDLIALVMKALRI